MLKLIKVSLTIFATLTLLLNQCGAMNSGSSGSVNSPAQSPALFRELIERFEDQYAGELHLVHMPPNHYDTQSRFWENFLSKAGGKHVVVRANNGRLYAMDRTPLGDSANILRTGSAVPGNNLYRIWRIKDVHEDGIREFMYMAFMRDERGFRWSNFNPDRIHTINGLSGALHIA